MLTRTEMTALGIAAATAALAGIAFGVWAAPPAALSEPAFHPEPQPITAEDPNLTRYRQMIASLGGAGPLYVVPGYWPAAQPRPAPSVRDEGARLEAHLARESAVFEAESRRMEAERVAWLDSRPRDWREARPPPAADPEPTPQSDPEATKSEDVQGEQQLVQWVQTAGR